MKSITAKEVAQYVSEGYTLIDVRDPFQTEGGTIKDAKLIPMAELISQPGSLDKNGAYIIYCGSGTRSQSTCNKLESAGFTNIVNLDGGYSKYRQEIKE